MNKFHVQSLYFVMILHNNLLAKEVLMPIEMRLCACGCGRSKLMTKRGKYYSQSCANREYLKRKKEKESGRTKDNESEEN